jgi:hypothetical protein
MRAVLNPGQQFKLFLDQHTVFEENWRMMGQDFFRPLLEGIRIQIQVLQTTEPTVCEDDSGVPIFFLCIQTLENDDFLPTEFKQA